MDPLRLAIIRRDLNSNAVVDPGELETLAQAGIASLDMGSTAQGNETNAGYTVNTKGHVQ